VAFKFIRKRVRRIKRQLHNKQFILKICVVVFFASVISHTIYMQHRRLTVDPTTYGPLLQLIAHAESKDNYNAYFGNAGNTSIYFTTMSIAEVMKWQADYIHQGSASDAVGRYQIISSTLISLVQQLGINTNELFNPSTQDRLAIALLERRGSENYVNNELSRKEFAANLAKEWAALPKVIGDDPSSYYAGDGLNKSLVSIDEVQRAIEPISSK